MNIRYANVAATLALVVAASSGAYAVTLAKNSVKTKHIKKSAVTKGKLAKSSVVSSKVKNGSLRASDFKAGQLPQGAPGIDGEDGQDGQDGQDGSSGLTGLEYVREAFSGLAPGATGTYTVECPAGKFPIAGGFDIDLPSYMRTSGAVNSGGSTTVDFDSWQVRLQNVAGNGTSAAGYAYALCASVEDGFPNPGWATS
jgi:hypothetical protein